MNERIRLGILSALVVRSPIGFGELEQMLSATDGNLSVHARKLEEAGFIACEKSFKERRPFTEYALTTKGPCRIRSVSRPHGSDHRDDA